MARNISKSKRSANPMLTRNGRTRIKVLSVTKLEEMLAKSSRPREKDKIQRRLNNIAAK